MQKLILSPLIIGLGAAIAFPLFAVEGRQLTQDAPSVVHQVREISSRNPGYTTAEKIDYLGDPPRPAGIPPPRHAPPPAAIKAGEAYRAARAARPARVPVDYSNKVTPLISRDLFLQQREPVSDEVLFTLHNSSNHSWSVVEAFGPYQVSPGKRVDVGLALTGLARILLVEFDAQGGPLGTKMIHNPDDVKKIITHIYITSSQTAMVRLSLLAPPGETLEIMDLQVSLVE